MNKDIALALEEITAVLKKHDMAGLFIVGNETHCDWRMEISPSWSCAWMEDHPEGTQLRIRSKRADYPTAEAQKQSIQRTTGLFVTFQHSMAKLTEQLDKVLVMIARHVDFLGKSTEED